MSTEEHPVSTHTPREDMRRHLSAAFSACNDWCDEVRQDAEKRLGVPAGDMAVLDDADYNHALDVRASIVEALKLAQ